MPPKSPLPLPHPFTDPETYIQSLLTFCTTNPLFQTLCGGVHILDFFTKRPDLYSTIIPEEWREWFSETDIYDILDLLMREDLQEFEVRENVEGKENFRWRNSPVPPESLIEYVREIRAHCLDRTFVPRTSGKNLDKKVLVGMNQKKVHEVTAFSSYVDDLMNNISNTASGRKITHLVDFGAGQNYLGRALASQPFNRHIIAIESRAHVVKGARRMDVAARLVERDVVRRNKKAFRAGILNTTYGEREGEEIGSIDGNAKAMDELRISGVEKETMRASLEIPLDGQGSVQYVEHRIQDGDLSAVIQQIINPDFTQPTPPRDTQAKQSAEGPGTTDLPNPPKRNLDFTKPVELSSPPENLDPLPARLNDQKEKEKEKEREDPALMIISLHSCGNLLHHGLRTLTINPSVQAVALVGCCYNLMGERLGPPTFKIPGLRASHPRLETTGNACDAHGFPMSERLLKFRRRLSLQERKCAHGGYRKKTEGCEEREQENEIEAAEEQQDFYENGIRLNITARMLAVQAPQNWSKSDSASFFTRHFYRALLQRMFLDRGVVKHPKSANEGGGRNAAGTGVEGETFPIVIGTLSKKCYETIVTYVRGAVAKVVGGGGEVAKLVQDRIGSLSEDEIQGYEERFRDRKKELSVIWSLMAFSAGVVEALIVVDRWLWLKEQECVSEAWVETAFDYAQSPRNLVIIGIKK